GRVLHGDGGRRPDRSDRAAQHARRAAEELARRASDDDRRRRPAADRHQRLEARGARRAHRGDPRDVHAHARAADGLKVMLLRSLRTGRGATSFLFALALVACSDAPRSAAPDVTLVSLNFLHGIFCPPDTDRCRLPDRTKLLFDFIAARGCPALVTLQEIWPPSVEQMEPYLATTCPFPYELVQGARLTGVDDETVLTRYPVLLVEQLTLYRQFRRVLWTRIAHPAGT